MGYTLFELVFFPSAITNEGSVTEPRRPWYALDKTISAPLSPLLPADKEMNGGMHVFGEWTSRCQWKPWNVIGCPASAEFLWSGTDWLCAFVGRGQKLPVCSKLSAPRYSTQKPLVRMNERTNEWMNEWMKYWGQSSLFLTFTTAAWSYALMNNGNHLTWALCKLLFSLYISLSHLFSTINASFLKLLIFISLSFHLFPQIIF